MATGQYKPQSAEEFRKHIASYSPKTVFFNAAYTSCNLPAYSKIKPITLLDGMAGPGKFGLSIFKRHIEDVGREHANIDVYFNDMRKAPVEMAREKGFKAIHCDIADIHKGPTRFHIVAIRYGIKDLPKEKQFDVFKSIYNVLVDGGRFVIADMVAFSKEAQEGVIEVHSYKQQLAGRDIKKEGECYIPTVLEWMDMYYSAGFSRLSMAAGSEDENRNFKLFTSDVDTRNWEGQFREGQDKECIQLMNRKIWDVSSKNESFKREFHVKFYGNMLKDEEIIVTLKFPIIVMAAQKQ